jgi:hypothetical protein
MKFDYLVHLVIFGAVTYALKQYASPMIAPLNIPTAFGKAMMSLPRPVMMVLMALPEQYVMHTYQPGMPLFQRLSVSVAMYIIHFAWNGMVMKPEKSYNELVWILGTAFYALKALGVSKDTFVALIAADSVMTLTLRSLA